MTSIVTIQSIDEDVVQTDENGRGEKTFTVTNISGNALRMGLKCQFENEEQKDWARPRGDVERELGDQGTDQIIVDITVPKDAAPGKYEFTLLAFKAQSPNLDFTVSNSIVIEVPEPAPGPEMEKKPFRWWIPVTAAVLFLSIGGGILTWVLWPSKMPNVVNKPVDEAIAMLEEDGFLRANVNIVEEYSGGVPEGKVKTQDPEADEKVEDKSELNVALVVEAFTKAVPDLTGKSVTEAEEALSSVGLTVGVITQERSDRAAGGTILRTDPAKDQRVVSQTAINLTVVTDTVQIPNVTGQQMSEAKLALEKLGLRVDIEQAHTPGEALRVLSTKPASPETVLPGSVVVLVVVKQMVTVANMVGQSEAQARKSIRKQNLKLRAVRAKATTTRSSGTVISHVPAKGATVAPNSPVTLIVARKPPKPRIAAKGTYAIQVNVNRDADLDRGKLNAGRDSDISLKYVNAKTPPKLMALNGARFGRTSTRAVGWNGCSRSRYRTSSINPAALKGRYLCVRTKNGKYSELRVLSVPQKKPIVGFSSAFMRFSFSTWSPPRPLRQSFKATKFSKRELSGLEEVRRELEPSLGLEPE